MFFMSLARGLLLSWAVAQATAAPTDERFLVNTTSGPVQGAINASNPEVRIFLGIPYAQPPVGNLRWSPPVEKNLSTTVHDGSKWGLNCPFFETKGPYIEVNDVMEFNAMGPYGDDCLLASVWAPNKPKGDKLPVFIFIHGGSLLTEGATVPYQNPSKWVQRTQSHIVVTLQYRLNIFGFPNAPGLEQQNLGFLDQRMGMEWVRDNIAAFGGDPERMILFGQSAGGGSTDIQNFAYPDDPIVKGFAPLSGSALITIRTYDYEHTDFKKIIAHFNCGSSDDAANLDCMRKIPSETIINFLIAEDQAGKRYNWAPLPDEKTYFRNYTQRAYEGKMSDRPVFYGWTVDEGISFISYPANPDVQGPDPVAAAEFGRTGFICPAHTLTQARIAVSNRPTWVREYRGNFTNISPRFWMGSWHCADLPLIFGTMSDYRGEATPFQKEVSIRMQDDLMAFALDSTHGLEKVGWSEAKAGKVIVYATNDNATGHGGPTAGNVATEVPWESVFATCTNWTDGNGMPPGGPRPTAPALL